MFLQAGQHFSVFRTGVYYHLKTIFRYHQAVTLTYVTEYHSQFSVRPAKTPDNSQSNAGNNQPLSNFHFFLTENIPSINTTPTTKTS